MADIGIYTKNADIQALATSKADATAKATAATDVYVLNVESEINAACRYNWSDAYSTLNADVKGILTATGAAACAIRVINANSTGFSARLYETTLDLLTTIYNQNLKFLQDKNVQAFMVEA